MFENVRPSKQENKEVTSGARITVVFDILAKQIGYVSIYESAYLCMYVCMFALIAKITS